MNILVYCPLNPQTPKIYGRALQSHLRLQWGENVDIVYGKYDHDPLSREEAYEEITAKYNHARDLTLKGGYDALLTVEADVIVPEMALERLTRTGADISYGLYCSRHGRHQWLAYTYMDYDNPGTPIISTPDEARAAWGGIVNVEGVGLGCTLIKRNVLEALSFRRELGGQANDWYFAIDAKYAGFSQVCDLGVVCGHMTDQPSPRIYWPDPNESLFYREEFLTPHEPVKQIEIVMDRVGAQKVYTMEAE